jgi:catechol 2,3-dioxygenase-like lactoylglutathione lyase family enzyme
LSTPRLWHGHCETVAGATRPGAHNRLLVQKKGAAMANLSLIGIFTKDIVRVSSFYRDLFGFKELDQLSSNIFRGLDTGKIWLGFNALEAYGLLGMSDYSNTQGNKFTLNFEVDSVAEVDRIFARACEMGATPVKRPFGKRYDDSAGTHWYLAVLLDPEGNAFRLSHPIS